MTPNSPFAMGPFYTSFPYGSADAVSGLIRP